MAAPQQGRNCAPRRLGGAMVKSPAGVASRALREGKEQGCASSACSLSLREDVLGNSGTRFFKVVALTKRGRCVARTVNNSQTSAAGAGVGEIHHSCHLVPRTIHGWEWQYQRCCSHRRRRNAQSAYRRASSRTPVQAPQFRLTYQSRWREIFSGASRFGNVASSTCHQPNTISVEQPQFPAARRSPGEKRRLFHEIGRMRRTQAKA